jgi:hypothetical protein
MPECWFSMLPDAGPCDGRLVRCHLIPKQKIRQSIAPALPAMPGMDEMRRALRTTQDDPRCWVWGCGGPMGPGGHHGQFKPDGPRPIPRHRLPPGLEEFAAELGLEWWLDYTYGPRWDEAERAAREAHDDVPLEGR